MSLLQATAAARGPLNRLPVGAKVLGLGVGAVLVVVLHGVLAASVSLGVALVIGAVARLPLARVGRVLRGLLVFAVVVGLLQWWWVGAARAVESVLDLVTLSGLGVIVSATTPSSEMLAALLRWLRPLRPLGVDPDKVALTINLAITSVPALLTLAGETRDAARARGLERRPRAYLTPFVIRVVARAHETGDALHARGLAD